MRQASKRVPESAEKQPGYSQSHTPASFRWVAKALSPTAPRCLRTARYGDQGVTPGELPASSGGIEGSDAISASETRSSALEVVGRAV